MLVPLLVLAGLFLQERAAQPSAPTGLCFELDRDAFGGEGLERGEAFTLLASDADLDGDADVLVNWHVYGPPALYWNQDGRFRRGERAWSLPEQARVPLLDAPRKAMLQAIANEPRPGITLWHSDTSLFWFFAFQGPFARDPAQAQALLVVESNRPIVGVRGLEPGAFELQGERTLRIPLQDALSGTHLFFATQEAAIQVKARVEGAALPFFVGPERIQLAGPLELWARDPHGLAWLDVTGNRAPELYVTRGALGGRLAPPLDPKRDDFYVARGSGEPQYERVELAPNYARGRMVQWVDLEGDGRLELYVGNKSSKNELLRLDPDSLQARDTAPELGLDFNGADAFAWLDLDGDGDDDLVTLDAKSGLGLARSEAGRRFASEDAAALGLRLAPAALSGEEDEEGAALERGVDDHDLVLLDFENDGDLDLLVTAWGKERRCALFLAEGTHFTDATVAAGLAGVQDTTQVVVADFDADADLDFLCLGSEPALLRNEGDRVLREPLASEWKTLRPRVGSACEADGDGRIDVVLAGARLALARNRSVQRGSWVQLRVERRGRVPVGALVRAFYSKGRVQVSRVGSIQRGHLSQSHGVIALASPGDDPLQRVEVLFPGGERRQAPVSGPGPLFVTVD